MKDTNVEKQLKYLYALQNVDSQLQEVLDLRGYSHGIAAGLQPRTAEAKAKVKALSDGMKQAKIDRDSADVGIIDCGEKVEKYKGQQLHVKSNKQYDALTREIEAAEAKSVKLEKEMEFLEGRMQLFKSDLEAATAQYEEVNGELAEKQKELREGNKEHEKEELKLQHEREKILARVEDQDVERYERIKKAKGGQAVVAVKRGACGGLYKRRPAPKNPGDPQKPKTVSLEQIGPQTR